MFGKGYRQRDMVRAAAAKQFRSLHWEWWRIAEYVGYSNEETARRSVQRFEQMISREYAKPPRETREFTRFEKDACRYAGAAAVRIVFGMSWYDMDKLGLGAHQRIAAGAHRYAKSCGITLPVSPGRGTKRALC